MRKQKYFGSSLKKTTIKGKIDPPKAKKITYQDWMDKFDSLHTSTQIVLAMQMINQPIGMSTYEEALEHNPEMFPDEIEHRRKWSLVPKHVEEAYLKELSEFENKHFGQAPHAGMGIVWYMNHPLEHKENEEWHKKHRKERLENKKKIHDKYLSEYGIELNGF